MLRFSEIIIGPLNQRPVCTGNKRGLCFHILFLCCLLSVCNVFTTPRAGHQSRPLPLVSYISGINLLARSISDLSVLATRGAYVFIFSFYVVCCLYITFLLPPERAPKAGPCQRFTYIISQTQMEDRYKIGSY